MPFGWQQCINMCKARGMQSVDKSAAAIDAIPGWFQHLDQTLFRWFLSTQQSEGISGNLAELGVYKGKSAVLIGYYIESEEEFTVVDLFEDAPPDKAGTTEQAKYRELSQESFEAHYVGVHPRLPRVVRGLSKSIVEHVKHGSHRFVHVDASHLYANVKDDIIAARLICGDQNIVVFDDIRRAHTPGVPAAVWPEIGRGAMHALLVSDAKLYATFDDPAAWRNRLATWLPSSGLEWETQEICEQPVYRVWSSPDRVPRKITVRAVGRGLLPPYLVKAITRVRVVARRKLR